MEVDQEKEPRGLSVEQKRTVRLHNPLLQQQPQQPPLVVQATLVSLSSFFHGCKPTTTTTLRLVGENPFRDFVLKGVHQLYAQTNRRHRNLAIEDEAFLQAEKSRRSEQNRTVYRSGTRFNKPKIERKQPLSTQLNPSIAVHPELFRPIVIIQTQQQKLLQSTATQFPGSIPVSLMRSDIADSVYNADHYFVVAPKTNGMRFQMVFTRAYLQEWILLIDRNQTIYIVCDMQAPTNLFDGCVLDGELVPKKDGSGYIFLVFDCIQSCGVPCSEYNYLIRLQIAGLLVEAAVDHKCLSTANLIVQVKSVYSMQQINYLTECVEPFLDHETDGKILTAVEPPVQMGQTKHIFKHKTGTDHTIDLRFHMPSPKRIDLLSVKGQHDWRLWFTIDLDRNPEKLMIHDSVRAQYPTPASLQNKIVECRYMPQSNAWAIEAVRLDKSLPNQIGTCLKTWQNIQENLSLLDVWPEGSLEKEERERLRLWLSGSKPKPTTALAPLKPVAPVPRRKAIRFV